MTLDKSPFGISNGFMANMAGADPEADGPTVTAASLEFGRTGVIAMADNDLSDAAPLPAASLQTLANYLTSGYWLDSGRTTRYYDIASNGHVLYYNVSGYSGDTNGISAARQTMAREAFELYEEVLGINFVETTSTSTNVDFFFRDNSGGAVNNTTVYAGNGGPIDFSIINVDDDWSNGTSNIGGPSGYTFQTFLHEIGHGLGLGHQGDYNLTASYASDAIWANDCWQQSMMSYFDQGDNTSIVASVAHLISPMAVDWVALNDLYASQGYGTGNAFNGNTVWGFGTNIATGVSAAYANIAALADTNAFCIVDGSGGDTVRFSNFSASQTIDLREPSAFSTTGTISSVGGLIGNMTIAVGTVIENAIGGSGTDVITGNDFANALQGNGGNDILRGGFGNDLLWGSDGDDVLEGGTGTDFASGGNNNDRFVFHAGFGVADEIDGDAGTDVFDFRAIGGGSSGVQLVIDLVAGFSVLGNFAMSITEVEDVWGSDSTETIRGTSGVNALYGYGGNDLIEGRTGNDGLYGGVGNDSVFGEAGNDYVEGSAGRDWLTGGAGRDILVGGGNSLTGTIRGDIFDFNLVSDSAASLTACDVLQAGGTGDAFDLAGAGNGDRIDLSDLPGVVWGDLSFANVTGNTRCMINVSGGAAAEMWIQINDGAVLASAYTAADFIFV